MKYKVTFQDFKTSVKIKKNHSVEWQQFITVSFGAE